MASMKEDIQEAKEDIQEAHICKEEQQEEEPDVRVCIVLGLHVLN